MAAVNDYLERNGEDSSLGGVQRSFIDAWNRRLHHLKFNENKGYSDIGLPDSGRYANPPCCLWVNVFPEVVDSFHERITTKANNLLVKEVGMSYKY